jgi:hypothetical protein
VVDGPEVFFLGRVHVARDASRFTRLTRSIGGVETPTVPPSLARVVANLLVWQATKGKGAPAAAKPAAAAPAKKKAAAKPAKPTK